MRPTAILASLLGSLLALPFTVIAAQDAAPAAAETPAAAAPAVPEEAVAPANDSSPRLTRTDVETWLDGFMPNAIASADIPGAVVVVVKDGQILYQQGYGYADVAKRTPVDPETTLFRPGSVSKLFTWTAVMQLVEQGKLDLDADVNQYLDFEIPAYDGKPITLRNIMTHTSGTEEKVRGLITANPADSIPLDEYVKLVPTRIFAPGTTPSYSNYATTLAGYIVQRVSGQSFDDYIDQHLLSPLGMKHSSFRQPLPANLLPLMSKGYKHGSDETQGFEIVNPAPAGSLSASGADMGHFMIAHLQNGAFGSNRILQAETARQMHGTALDMLPPLHRMLLGFYEEDVNGRRVIAHAGDTQWFHSDLDLFIDDGVGLFVSFNSAGKEGVAGKLRIALFKRFADRYLPGPAPDGKVDAETAKLHAQQAAGVYEVSRRTDDTFLSLLNLASQAKIQYDGKESIIFNGWTDLSGQPIKWREIAPYVWRDVNGSDRLAAQVVDGKVVRFSFEPVSPFMVYDRVPWWKSSSWLMPASIAALLALLLTVLAWPVSAILRRYYGAPYKVYGRDAKAHRIIRITALAVLAAFVIAVTTMVVMMSGLDSLVPRNDWLVNLVRVLTLVVFPIGAAVSLWNAWVVLRSSRRKWAKFWAIVLALSCLVILWVGYVFSLIGYGAHY